MRAAEHLRSPPQEVQRRQLGPEKARFAPEDRTVLAARLTPLPHEVLHGMRLPVRPDTVLRWPVHI